ncbi:hypothetical protein ROHU_029631 [Labeo rohita]|uniref:Uncharacterized protein n=1 Tax=Labeo rohita TaxID=84645 RepID=A0A498M3Q4_LABRO|nr:hypothetical protein ROHU_029631 [Labeo rohita]
MDCSEDVLRRLCGVFQRGRRLEDYVKEFISLCHLARASDNKLKDCFLMGLDPEVLCEVDEELEEDPDWSLVEFLDAVLLIRGSELTVGPVEEDYSQQHQRSTSNLPNEWCKIDAIFRLAYEVADVNPPVRTSAPSKTPTVSHPLHTREDYGTPRGSPAVSEPQKTGFSPVSWRQGPCAIQQVSVSQPGEPSLTPSVPVSQPGERSFISAVQDPQIRGCNLISRRQGPWLIHSVPVSSVPAVSNPQITAPSPVSRSSEPCRAQLVPVLQPKMLFKAQSVPVIQPGVLFSAQLVRVLQLEELSPVLAIGSNITSQREGLCVVQSVPVTQPGELQKVLTVSSPQITGPTPVTRYEEPCVTQSVPVTQPGELQKVLTVSSPQIMGPTPVTRYEEPCVTPSVPVTQPGELQKVLTVSSPQIMGPTPVTRYEEPCVTQSVPVTQLEKLHKALTESSQSVTGLSPLARCEGPCSALSTPVTPPGDLLPALVVPRPQLMGPSPVSWLKEPLDTQSVPDYLAEAQWEDFTASSLPLSGPSPELPWPEPSVSVEFDVPWPDPPEPCDVSDLLWPQPPEPLSEVNVPVPSVAALTPEKSTPVVDSLGSPLVAAHSPGRSIGVAQVKLLHAVSLAGVMEPSPSCESAMEAVEQSVQSLWARSLSGQPRGVLSRPVRPRRSSSSSEESGRVTPLSAPPWRAASLSGRSRWTGGSLSGLSRRALQSSAPPWKVVLSTVGSALEGVRTVWPAQENIFIAWFAQVGFSTVCPALEDVPAGS